MMPLYGTDSWLLLKLRPPTELKIRRELRRLERSSDARLVCLWIVSAPANFVSYAGDFDAIPTRMPELRSTVPSSDDIVMRNGEREHAVIQQVILGRNIVKLAVAAIAPGVPTGPALFDLVADAAERLEDVVVHAIS